MGREKVFGLRSKTTVPASKTLIWQSAMDLQPATVLGWASSGSKRLVNEFDIKSEVGQRHHGYHYPLEMIRQCGIYKNLSPLLTGVLSERPDAPQPPPPRLWGLTSSGASDISIVVTELANNVLRHATTGELLLCPVEDERRHMAGYSGARHRVRAFGDVSRGVRGRHVHHRHCGPGIGRG